MRGNVVVEKKVKWKSVTEATGASGPGEGRWAQPGTSVGCGCRAPAALTSRPQMGRALTHARPVQPAATTKNKQISGQINQKAMNEGGGRQSTCRVSAPLRRRRRRRRRKEDFRLSHSRFRKASAERGQRLLVVRARLAKRLVEASLKPAWAGQQQGPPAEPKPACGLGGPTGHGFARSDRSDPGHINHRVIVDWRVVLFAAA